MTSNTSESEIIEAIRLEHEALRKKLGNVHSVLAGCHLAGEKVAAMLLELHDELVVHFTNEEFNGFFGEVTSRAPQLSPAADKLCAEHRDMLHKASELAQFARAGADSQEWWRELKTRFHVFSTQLMHHESEENSLLQQAYQDDIGAHD
jgi:iron-sulfur cluster repair protein YtfE (RIC family)